MLDRLFVYGTLMHGYDHPMAKLLSDSADYLGPASMPGRLYLIKHYPGLVEAEGPAERVFGDLFRLHRPRELIAQLDDYEDCGEGCAQPAPYRREILPVDLAGEAVEAYVYIYNFDVSRLPRIASGRFADAEVARFRRA